jgi:DNA polymerase III subunit gamma/tau
MTPQHKIWAIRAAIGTGVCALLTAWMVPNTKPIARQSPLAGMSAIAEAQKPSVSAVPDSAIPAWAANLPASAAPRPAAAPPIATADAPAASQPVPIDTPPAPDTLAPIVTAAEAAPQTPAQADPAPALRSDPMATYNARRAEWRAQVDAALQGRRDPG